MNPSAVPGEASITPAQQQSVASDIVSPSGLQNLQQKLAQAISEKSKLDFILGGIAKKVGADFSSRIKNPQTAVRKIVQKRMEDRNYGVEDLNDNYGGRFVMSDSKMIPEVKKMMEKASSLGVFDIKKAQVVENGNYHAFHFDIETPEGTKGEIQLMNPQEELDSVANHSLRAVFGEKKPDQVNDLEDAQTKMIKAMPDAEAKGKAKLISLLQKRQEPNPLDPRVVATILQKK